MSSILEEGALPYLLAGAVGWCAAAWFLAKQYGLPFGRLLIVGWAFVLIVAVTLFRGGPHAPLLRNPFGWLVHWSRVAGAVETGTEWQLNVALFAPAGFLLGWSSRRPWLVVAALCLLSFSIESLQGPLAAGAQDTSDWVANTLGGAIGVLLALVIRWCWRRVRQRYRPTESPLPAMTRQQTAWWSLAVVVVVVAGTVGVVTGANRRESELLSELHQRFDRTTRTDVESLLHQSWEDFASAIPSRPTGNGYTAQGAFVARYAVAFFGVRRCVFVQWTTDDVTFRKSNGSDCTAGVWPPEGQ